MWLTAYFVQSLMLRGRGCAVSCRGGGWGVGGWGVGWGGAKVGACALEVASDQLVFMVAVHRNLFLTVICLTPLYILISITKNILSNCIGRNNR